MTTQTTDIKHLALYYYDGCFFCHRVRRAADKLGIKLEERNILRSREHMSALVEARGRRTVPVLHITRADGQVEWMPESEDIVDFLRAVATQS